MPVDIFYIPLDALEAHHIKDLEDRAQVETMHLEYKEQLPPTRKEYNERNLSKSEKDPFVEFGCDVSAFANAQGGDLIFGIGEAKKTKAPILIGLPDFDLAECQQRLLHLMNQFVEPHVFGVRFKPITMSDGKKLLVVRVPKSLHGPHQVELPRKSFWIRNASGKDFMDYQAIQNAFTSGVEVIERAREWRDKRLKRIYADSPFGVGRRPLQILHLIPLSFRNAQRSVNLATIAAMSGILRPASIYKITNDRFTADGFASIIRRDDNNVVHGYTQIYRNGQLESVSLVETGKFQEHHIIYSKSLENEFVLALERYLLALRLAGANPPILISLAYQNIAGLRMHHNNLSRIVSPEITIDEAVFPDSLIADWPNMEEVLKISKDFLDCLWQSAGVEKSLNYPWNDLIEQDLDRYVKQALSSLV